MKQLSIFLITGVVGIALGLWLGWSSTPRPIVTTEVVRDTIVLREVVADTVTLSRIVYRDLPTVQRDTTYIHDTVRVAVPLSLHTFQGEDYRAEVEGFAVTLKKMEFYPKTIHHTTTSSPRWGVGVQCGVTLSEKGFTPYLGVGVQYNIFSW